jgi:ABC-type transport system involved in multi-copper enzyme maturation permease subunit
MIWKEVFIEPGLRLNWIGWFVFIGLFCLSFYFFAGSRSDFFDEMLGRPGRSGNWLGIDRWIALAQLMNPWSIVGNRWSLLELFFAPWVRTAGTIVACLMLVGVAVRASSSISGERDRGTLEGLLTSPLDSHDILFAKWLGSLLGVRRAWFWLGLIWGIGLLTNGLHPAALMLTFVAWLVYASCLAGVGIWFSISCPTTLRATLYTLAATFGASLGHWVIWLGVLPFCSPFRAREILTLQACITPPAVLYSLSATASEVDHSGQWELLTLYAGFGLFLWALAACGIWTVSRARFRRLTSRMPYQRPEFYYSLAYQPNRLGGPP